MGPAQTVVMEVVAAGAVSACQALGLSSSADAESAAADGNTYFGQQFPNGSSGKQCTALAAAPRIPQRALCPAVLRLPRIPRPAVPTVPVSCPPV